MARALALLAALGLAACSVNVEGAPCGAPGTAVDCPSGQACGNDGRCSERAATCTSPEARCTPNTKLCTGEGGTAILKECTSSDPICGTWVETDCAAQGLMCSASDSTTACSPVPCSAPGSTAGCPTGQACGNDLRCSAAAAACVGSRCSPGAKRCGGAAGAQTIEECTAADAVCGRWETVNSCSARSLVCDAGGGTPTCVCAAHPPGQLFVDVGAGGSDPGLAATGADAPAACRLGSIAEGLSRATSGTTVIVAGSPATYPVAQLRVPRGVALVAGDTPLDPSLRIIEDTVANGPGVILEQGTRLAGFTVRAMAPDPRPLAIKVALESGTSGCNLGDKVTLESVRVAVGSGASLTRGIELAGCDVDLVDVEIADVAGAGLWVGTAQTTTVATMQRGSVRGCQTGIKLTAGDLRLDRTTVADSTGTGVEAGDNGLDTQFTASDAVFSGNGDTALVLFGNAKVDLQDNRVCGNRAVTSRSSAGRLVGGISAQGAPPGGGLVFKRNELHGNVGDQVLVWATNGTWALDASTSATACPSERNLFLGYSGANRGLVTSNASATARWNGWEGITPTPSQDYQSFGTGSIDAVGSGVQYCDPVPTPRPCP